MPAESATNLIAVDIGNSRIKLGRFDIASGRFQRSTLPEPSESLDVAVTDRSGQFDADRLAPWLAKYADGASAWRVASVHRGAAERFVQAVTSYANDPRAEASVRGLTYKDLPMRIDVVEPQRVGIDRLLAAFAADRVRRRDRAAIVVDLGTAMTVDRVDADGAFAGGAILPGIAMAARALSDETDALPRIGADRLDRSPAPLGKSTTAAIESGLYWGAVGAIRELIDRYSLGEALRPDVFLTGGASAHVAGLLDSAGGETGALASRVRHVPHLVLAGIALVHEATSEP